jgi:hypothetical protein
VINFAQIALVFAELGRDAKPAFLSLVHLTLVDAIAFCVGPISPLTAVVVNTATPLLLGAAFLPLLALLVRWVPRARAALAPPEPRRAAKRLETDGVSALGCPPLKRRGSGSRVRAHACFADGGC